jgi:hypothetical protein
MQNLDVDEDRPNADGVPSVDASLLARLADQPHQSNSQGHDRGQYQVAEQLFTHERSNAAGGRSFAGWRLNEGCRRFQPMRGAA